MKHKGRLAGECVFITVNERLLVVSLGLLMTGLAHGATEDGLGQDCRVRSGAEGTSSQRQNCAPVGRKPGDDKAPVYQDLRHSGSGNGVIVAPHGQGAATKAKQPNREDQNVVASPVDDETTEKRTENGDGEDERENEEKLAADGSVMDMDSTTAAPNEDVELFKVDIETGETEDELPSAVQRDLFNMEGGSQRTSDDYEARTYSLSYRNHRREWFWPWQESTRRGLDWGVDVDRAKGEVGTTGFEGLHTQGMLGGYLTRGTYLQGQIGRHVLETDQGDRTITSRRVSAMLGLKHSFSVQLESGRDFIYSGGSVTGGITRQLTSLDHAAFFRWRPDTRLRIQGSGGYRKYDQENEENVARQADLSALYGISPEWPWIWGGLGAQILKYEHQVPDYWSPNRYTAYGLRFESSFPVYKRLSASAAFNLNRQSENGAKGNGYDIRAGLQYRLYNHLYARLDLSKSKSLQQSSDWTSDNIFFTLSSPLF